MEFVIDMLNRQRESIDAMYQSGVQLLEHALRTGETTSPEEYRRITEELWRKMMDSFKTQSEAQLREFQKWAETFFDTGQKKQPKRKTC